MPLPRRLHHYLTRDHIHALTLLTSVDDQTTLTCAYPVETWEAITVETLHVTWLTAAWTCYQLHALGLVTITIRPGIDRQKPHVNLYTPTPLGLLILHRKP